MTPAAAHPRAMSARPVEGRAAGTAAPAAPPGGFTFGAGWGMLACGLAVGLAVGQFAGSRSVQAELYVLKQDVRSVRESADALTAAAGRGRETTSLLADLVDQRESVRTAAAAQSESAAAWRETAAATAAALAEVRKPLVRARAVLADAAGTLAAAKSSRELAGWNLDAWEHTAARTADATTAAAGLAELREVILTGRDSHRDAETTLRRMLSVQRRLSAEGANATAARLAAADAAAAHRALIAEQGEALAGAKAALAGMRRLSGEASSVAAEAADAAVGLRDAAVALADLRALKTMVADAGTDFPKVWKSLDALFTLRDTLLAEAPATQIAAGPKGDVN